MDQILYNFPFLEPILYLLFSWIGAVTLYFLGSIIVRAIEYDQLKREIDRLQRENDSLQDRK